MKSIYDVAKGPFRNEFIEKISRSAYDQINGLNPSSLVHRKDSALEVIYEYESSSEDTDAMRFGRCCHAMLLEPDTFQERWIPWPGASYGKNFEKFAADFPPGTEFIKTDGAALTLEHATKCVMAAMKKPFVRDLVSECVTEVAVLTEEHGLQCKGLIDAVSTKGNRCVIIDPKFTNDISKDKFSRNAAGFSYHVKMACYWKWFQKVTGKTVHDVFFLTTKTRGSFDAALARISESDLEDGWSQANKFIHQIADDIARREFHGVDGGHDYYDFEVPYWALEDEHDAEA